MANKTNLSIGAAIIVIIAAYLGIDLNQDKNTTAIVHSENTQSESKDDQASAQQAQINSHNTHVDNVQNSQNQQGLEVIQKSFERKLSNVQVQSVGKVKAILRDDNEGARHQKFILLLDNGLTVLVAHNIDLAPRIEQLQKGDTVEFFGEYEYSEQGGVIHWTHHDPQGRHVSGWLKHQGKSYS